MSSASPQSSPSPRSPAIPDLRRRHLRLGWWSLLLFVGLGLGLEALHGFKVAAYLDLDQETRRLMWTLAHAHGTLLALVNLAFLGAVERLPAWAPTRRSLASRCLAAATLLIPGGFFAGGFGVSGGDPGLGILAVAAGGLALFLAVLLTATATSREPLLSMEAIERPRKRLPKKER